MFTLSNTRANQKSAIGLHNGMFNGGVSVLLGVVDAKKLTFNANITFQTGDVALPAVTFSPCSDDGEYKKFSNIDDAVTWVKGAFLDFTTLTLSIADAGTLATAFVPPTDSIADALKQKNKFTALKAGIQDNKTKALARVTADEASGWNALTAHPALQANYAADVAKKDAIVAIEAYYTDRIAHFAAIV